MRKIILLFTIFICLIASMAYCSPGESSSEEIFCRVCPKCGAKLYSNLAMSCDVCNSPLEAGSKALKNDNYASLRVRLMYTGNDPEKLAKYVKLHVNGKFIGKIYRTDIQKRSSDGSNIIWDDGLGGIYTAVYEQSFAKVSPGVKRIVLEMRFKRMGGLLKSNKKAVFDYVAFKGGEETFIDHYFNSAVTFTQHKKIDELLKGKEIPVLPKGHLRTGSGTAEITIDL